MKTISKFTLLAAVISISFVACETNRPADIADTTKMDSSSTFKSSADTNISVDSGKSLADSSKNDTKSKTITRKVEVKKTVIKKNN